MQTETVIKRFITEELLDRKSQALPDPDESLISTGILDSVAVLTLLMFIEKQFHIMIADGEVTPTNLGTINRITNFVESKAKAHS